VEQEDFTEEEKEEIEVMRNTPKIYEHLIHSIAPAVYGIFEKKMRM
jgi:replicative DNA helicase Mcm